MTDSLILASASVIRAQILKNAALKFQQRTADCDERSLTKKHLEFTDTPKKMAIFLAQQKALNVSQKDQHAYVVGCDQILEFQGQILHKVQSLQEAHQRLKQFSGRTHHLINAITLYHQGKEIWSYSDSVYLTMHKISEQEIETYLQNVGEKVLSSVGTYQIEGEAIRFFKEICGDYFSILGLPLLPLLTCLRQLQETHHVNLL